MVVKQDYRGPDIKPLLPNYIADKLKYTDSLNMKKNFSNMEYIKKNLQMAQDMSKQHGLIGVERRGQESKSHKAPMTIKASAKKRMLMPLEQRSPRSERRGMPPIAPTREDQNHFRNKNKSVDINAAKLRVNKALENSAEFKSESDNITYYQEYIQQL